MYFVSHNGGVMLVQVVLDYRRLNVEERDRSVALISGGGGGHEPLHGG